MPVIRLAIDDWQIRWRVRSELSPWKNLRVMEGASAISTSAEADVVVVLNSEAVRQNPRTAHEPRTISVLRTSDANELVTAWINGAWGYFTVESAGDEMIDVIQRVCSGQCQLLEAICKAQEGPALLRSLSIEMQRAPVFVRLENSPLTQRQQQILLEISRGVKGTVIAKSLHMAEQTIKNQLLEIRRKTGAKTNAEAVLTAYMRGWLVLRPGALGRSPAPAPPNPSHPPGSTFGMAAD